MKQEGQPVSIHPLELEGALETLTSQYRWPSLIRAFVGPESRISHVSVNGDVELEDVPDTSKTIYFCFVPPEGTQPGDVFRSAFGVANDVDLVSPEGVSRGRAFMHTLSEEQGTRLNEKISQLWQAYKEKDR